MSVCCGNTTSTIDEDGKYMAPVTKGIYKINAIGNESQHVAYAMVVVKGT